REKTCGAGREARPCYGGQVSPSAPPETTVPPTPAQPAPAQVKRPNTLVGLGLLAAWLALGAWIWVAPAGRAVFAFVMLGWVLAVMAHEFAHAAVAYAAGDWTVRPKGYLS